MRRTFESTSAPLALCGCLVLAIGCMPSAGDPGTGGSNGAAGTTGSAGTSGNAGTSGTAGSSGNAGTTGSAGSGTGTSGTTGSAGSTATAGTTGSGGSSAGTTGSGGRGGSSAGRGGTTGSAGTTGTAGTGAGGTGTGNCTFTQSSMISPMIGTVGIVTWSTTLAGATSAKIDFGLTTSYGMTAPVSTIAASNRTLLLGMKTQRMYNYRITAMAGSMSCESPNYTIMTGSLQTGLMKPTLNPATATGLSGGFLITALYQGTPTTAFILDADGDYVWAFGGIGGQLTGARMSYDGKYMWINNANVPSSQGAMVRRVSMDGMTNENYSSMFTGMNHQMAILPDETVAYYAYGSNGCDDVKEFKPSGAAPGGTGKTVVNSRSALRINDGMCHLNNIQYSPEDDSLVFSNLQSSQVAKVKRSDGSTTWIMNGSSATITGINWSGGNHGIHLLGLNRLLIFNNNNGGQPAGSIAKEYMFSGTTGMQIWSYTAANPAQPNMVMGDLQRMANGNTVVCYSTRGVIDEVNAQGMLLQRMTAAGTGNFGYIEKRATLYGPPPR